MSAVNLLVPALGAGMGIICRDGGAGVGCTRPVAWQTPRDTCQGAGHHWYRRFGLSVPASKGGQPQLSPVTQQLPGRHKHFQPRPECTLHITI